jgi:hypothetical protein
MIEEALASKILRAFISGYFDELKIRESNILKGKQDKDDDDDDYKDDDEESSNGRQIEKRKLDLYVVMQDKIRSLGLKFGNGAEAIKLHNYIPLWILLGLGFTLAAFLFLWEKFVKPFMKDLMIGWKRKVASANSTTSDELFKSTKYVRNTLAKSSNKVKY